MIDFNFIAGFVVGMLTCLGLSVISAAIIYFCLVGGARADQFIEQIRENE